MLPRTALKAVDVFLKLSDILLGPIGIRTAGIVDYLTSPRVCDNKKAIKDLGIKPVDTLEMVKMFKASGV